MCLVTALYEESEPNLSCFMVQFVTKLNVSSFTCFLLQNDLCTTCIHFAHLHNDFIQEDSKCHASSFVIVILK